MRGMQLGAIGVILVLILSGCSGGKTSFQADTFSSKDMCLTHIKDKKQICYGDARSDAEKLLGTGNKGSIAGSMDYESGISVFYRNDVVAGLALKNESKGIYKTARGAQAGMAKQEMKDLYGEKYAVEAGVRMLDYSYDSVSQQLLQGSPGASQPQADKEKVYLVSAIFDEEGAAQGIWLIDQKMATLFQ